MFLNPFRCTVVLEKQATKQFARLQELWWKQATEDLANEEANACSPGGMHAYMDRVFMQCFLNPFRCTQLYSKTGHEATCRLQELWWKQATEDLANEEAKWVKLKDKKASYRIRKGN
ncbi:hypothetical protein TNCV_3694881 [Trichonephila clavipes]|nr:hypothetical protein TNCV_3694881 [Trichonephila clavipes]